ncbi:bifunctional Isoleucine-tRNA ligase/Isoleucyl tRNA synthetase type 1 [Babesia duncani]|uniref:isoleucine--tRNA ligase n=1 Tax=Babesia duncani TaxID=323732 RepID=A0AAD9PJ86_9APIC|nr:bifunctional Isoleucine-tRNA ligase/Isoleucyl tRNA synthetase type 1 [Babesia duncani]
MLYILFLYTFDLLHFGHGYIYRNHTSTNYKSLQGSVNFNPKDSLSIYSHVANDFPGGAEKVDVDQTLNLPKKVWPETGDVTKDSLNRQTRIQRYWEDQDVYRKVCLKRLSQILHAPNEEAELKNKLKLILDGPPYANGHVHCGHFLNKTIKDVLLRFLLLNGNLAIFVPGWDCHGMPIETKVLSNLMKTMPNSEIDLNNPKIGSTIRQNCNDAAIHWIGQQMSTFKKCGIWGFWNDHYATNHSYYERMVVEAFSHLLKSGKINCGNLPQHFSPSSQTVVAESELVKQERDILSAYVAFQIMDKKNIKLDGHVKYDLNKYDLNLVCWTSLPWTIVGNRGLALCNNAVYTIYHPDKSKRDFYVLANNDRVKLFDESSAVGTIKGSSLAGLRYLDPVFGNEYTIYPGSFVDYKKGTGIVHLCPAHGFDDFLCLHNTGAVPNNLIDEQEHYYKGIHFMLDGKHISCVTKRMLEVLLKDNLIKAEPVVAMVNVDWRTLEPTHVRMTQQWCLDISDKDALQFRLGRVEMIPKAAENYLKSALDQRPKYWCLSRQRVWGTPIPLVFLKGEYEHNLSKFKTKQLDSGEIQVELDTRDIPDYNLGDRIWKKMPTRPNVLDVWFESGLVYKSVSVFLPVILQQLYAACITQYSLDRNPSLYDNLGKLKTVPTYAIEGQDQHRGWYQSSLILHSLLEPESKEPVFQTIITHGFVRDARGQKLSKSRKGDTRLPSLANLVGIQVNGCVDPRDVDKSGHTGVEKDDDICPEGAAVGIDALRLWVCSNDFLQRDVELSTSNLNEARDLERKMVNFFKFVLGNCHDLKTTSTDWTLHCGLDVAFLRDSYKLLDDIKPLYLSGQFHKIIRGIEEFVSQTSRIYLGYIKDRLYVEPQFSFQRSSAQATLLHIARNLLIAIAPMVPHLAEDLKPHLFGDDFGSSIFEQSWPKAPSKLPKTDIAIHEALEIRKMVNAARCKIDEQVGLHALVIPESYKLLQKCINELDIDMKLLLRVADFSFEPCKASGNSKYSFSFYVTNFEKCSRCWLYRGEVSVNGGFCNRCQDAMQLFYL